MHPASVWPGTEHTVMQLEAKSLLLPRFLPPFQGQPLSWAWRSPFLFCLSHFYCPWMYSPPVQQQLLPLAAHWNPLESLKRCFGPGLPWKFCFQLTWSGLGLASGFWKLPGQFLWPAGADHRCFTVQINGVTINMAFCNLLFLFNIIGIFEMGSCYVA